MGVSLIFRFCLTHAVAPQSGNHFEITMPLPYRIEFNVMHAYFGAVTELEKGFETLKGQFLLSLPIVFNIRRRVGSPLHLTLWWK